MQPGSPFRHARPSGDQDRPGIGTPLGYGEPDSIGDTETPASAGDIQFP